MGIKQSQFSCGQNVPVDIHLGTHGVYFISSVFLGASSIIALRGSTLKSITEPIEELGAKVELIDGKLTFTNKAHTQNFVINVCFVGA